MDQGSIGVEVRPRGKQDREGFTGKRQSGNPEVAAPESLAEIVPARFATLTQFPRIAPRRPKYQVLSFRRELSRLPTNVRRVSRPLFREPQLMSDMASDSASPLRIPRTVVNDDQGTHPLSRKPRRQDAKR